MGLLSDETVKKAGNPLDTLGNHLAKRLAYNPGERDIIIMHHEIDYTWPNGKKENKTLDFIQYGDVNGMSAMAKTVGLTAAIAAKMVLESKKRQQSRIILVFFFSLQLKFIYKTNRGNTEHWNGDATNKRHLQAHIESSECRRNELERDC